MMMTDQKKILVLGGSKHMIDVVKAVRRMGMLPFVVDDTVGAPAKTYAGKSYAINAANTDKLAEIVQKEKISGVYSVFEGINTWHAVALCKKTALPFYAPDKHSGMMFDKEGFDDICDRFKIPIIKHGELLYIVKDFTRSAWDFPMHVTSAAAPGEKAKSFAAADVK